MTVDVTSVSVALPQSLSPVECYSEGCIVYRVFDVGVVKGSVSSLALLGFASADAFAAWGATASSGELAEAAAFLSDLVG